MAGEPREYYPFVFPRHDVPSFDRDAFDDSIRDSGVRLVHYRGFRCPVGIGDQFDIRRAHAEHDGCSNGWVYREAGEFVGLFHSHSTGNRAMDSFLFIGSHVQLTVPTKYEDKDEPIMLKIADRLFLKEPHGLVVTDQLFTAHGSGIDKMRFPVAEVENMMDDHAIEYASALDFVVRPTDGRIVWTTDRRPTPGAVCSIRYRYQPYWYVKELLHEIRVAQVQDPHTLERSIQRMPSTVLCAREHVFETEQNEPGEMAATPRDVTKPDENELFGPRV